MDKTDSLIKVTSTVYFLAYKCLMEKNKEVADYSNLNKSIYIVPAATLATFSCEIALKCLLSKSIKNPHGHDLKCLFDKLQKTDKDKYTKITINLENCLLRRTCKEDTYDVEDFSKELNECRLAFINNRYIYEKPTCINIDFIETFMFALNDEEQDYEAFLDNRI